MAKAGKQNLDIALRRTVWVVLACLVLCVIIQSLKTFFKLGTYLFIGSAVTVVATAACLVYFVWRGREKLHERHHSR